MARTILPKGKQSFSIELWNTKGTKLVYEGQITFYVDEDKNVEDLVTIIETNFPSHQTKLKIKSGKKFLKSITLPYGAAQILHKLKSF